MSAPKPWERKQSALNSTPNATDIITPSGSEIAANPQALAANALSKTQNAAVHKSPTQNNTATNSTTAAANTTGTTNSTLSTVANRPGYGSTYGSSYGGYNRYGGGMYGGGMYGGGMYSPYSSMYGGGMYGANQGGFLNTMNQYVFSICQAAQMIEYNANGIGGFVVLIKKFFHWLLSGSKEWIIYLGALVISNVKSVREWTKKKVYEYFYQKDLSSEELSKQVKTLETVMKGLQLVVGLFLVHYLLLTIKKMFV